MAPRTIATRASTRRAAPKSTPSPTTKPHNPTGVTKKKPAKPDILALRAKLILANSTLVKPQLTAEASATHPQAQHPWLTTDAHKARFYVLDGATWDLKQYGQEWEAVLMSRGNPPVDAGNGVWIYVRDDERYLRAMRAVAGAAKMMQGNCLGLDPFVGGKRRSLGRKRGSCLHWKVVEAVERIRAGEI
jgi:hypothetical protein